MQESNTPEPVYLVDDYWDGPRSGIASYRGQPHAFACIFDEERGDWSDVFVLRPLSEETLRRVLEEWGRVEALTENWPRSADGRYAPIPARLDEEIRHRLNALRREVMPTRDAPLRAVGGFSAVSGDVPRGPRPSWVVVWSPEVADAEPEPRELSPPS
jgi:hypothetical protein